MDSNGAYRITATSGEFQGLLSSRAWADLLYDYELQLEELHNALEDQTKQEQELRILQGACASVRKQMALPSNMLAQLLEPRVEEKREEEEDELDA